MQSNEQDRFDHSGERARFSGKQRKRGYDAATAVDVTHRPLTAELSAAANAADRPPAEQAITPPRKERYFALGELGRGGWGVVERVLDHELEREVAIKRLCPKLGNQPEIQERFLHEAKITSQLQHPSIVPVHEMGRSGSGETYYVMKLLEGRSLREHIREVHAAFGQTRPTKNELRDACLPLLERFVDVCYAVAYAHQQGIVHRDLKPTNVMVGEFGETIVVDWGLAKYIDIPSDAPPAPSSFPSFPGAEAGSTATQVSKERSRVPSREAQPQYDATVLGTVVGTPAYMSPEQAGGCTNQLGPYSDIYSLGVMLFEIVSGRTPFSGCSVEETLARIRCGDTPGLRDHQPAAHRALHAICATAMAHRPQDRYLSAALLAEDVKRFIAGDAVVVDREPLADQLVRWGRRHQSLAFSAVTAGGVILLASFMFGLVIHQAHKSEKRARQELEVSHRESLSSLATAREAADAGLLELCGVLQFYPGLQPICQELVQHAIHDYEELANLDIDTNAGGSHDPLTLANARLECSRAKLRLADLLRTLPQFADPSRHPLEIYQQAQEDLKLVRTSLEALGPSSMTQALIAHVNLELVNARIGILSVDSSLARPASGDPSFPGDLARWLYAQLPEQCTTEAAHVHLRDEFHDGQWDEKIVTAAVKLKLATAQVISPEDELELQLSNLQLAVQWSRWLMCTRGKASDHHLSQAAQEAFADCLWLSGQQEASLVVYDQIVADAVAWSEKYSLRSDALQTLARARRKAAQRFKEIGDIARAEQLRKLAEEDMTRALSLLRLPDGNLDLAGR